MKAYLVSAGFFCILAGCAQDRSSFFQPAPQQLFKSNSEIKSVVFEVDYGPNAQPYAANDWSLFRANINAIFAESPKSLILPSTPSDMDPIQDAGGTPFSGVFNRRRINSLAFDKYQIRDLADAYRNHLSTAEQVSFYFVWLDGFFRDVDAKCDDGTTSCQVDLNAPVLGITIRELGITAIFKPVVDSVDTTGNSTNLRAFVEQTTLIHEFGHSIGLVNNGLPMKHPHQEEQRTDEKGNKLPLTAHCMDPTCVMYYKNEGIKDLKDFRDLIERTGSNVIFDSHCLADVYEASL